MPRKLKSSISKVKKKKGIKSAYAICIANLFKKTTYNKGHRHKWMSGRGYTTFDGGHKHKINRKKMIAMMGGKYPHIHRLLKK